MDLETKRKLEAYNDEFVKFRRYVEDALENIDFDNLSHSVRTSLTGYSSSKAGVESNTTDSGAFARMFAEYKNAQAKTFAEFRTEAAKNYATVQMLAQYQSETEQGIKTNADSIADIKATADSDRAVINSLTAWRGTTYESFDTAITNADATAKGYADAAESNANGYTDNKISNIDTRMTTVESSVSEVKLATADFATKEELTSYKSEVTTKFTNADMTAKGYADTAESNANDNAIEKAKAALSQANAYTDAKIETEIFSVESKVYTKDEANSNFATTATLTDYATKIYANSAAVDALSDAKEYTKESVSGIAQRTNASGAFIDLFATAGDGNLKKDDDGNYVTTENGEYIFVKDGKETTISAADVAGMFIQKLNNGTSSIKLNANKISFGRYAGVTSDGAMYLKRLFGSSTVECNNQPGAFYLDIDSDFDTTSGTYGGDLIMKSVMSFDSYTDTDVGLYGFRYGVTSGNSSPSVHFVVGKKDSDEKQIIGYSYGEEKTYPKGRWDFTEAEVSGLAVYFS